MRLAAFDVRTMAAKLIDPKKRLVGSWKSCDGFRDVVITIKLKADRFAVSALDKDDGEIPKVYEITWDIKQHALGFSLLWSTGRLVEYRFTPSLVAGRLELTYVYRDQELWERV
jgi:hypothetical protein